MISPTLGSVCDWPSDLLICRILPVSDSHFTTGFVSAFMLSSYFYSQDAAHSKHNSLTKMSEKDYSEHITAKSVIRMAVLDGAAIGRKVFSNAAFLLSQCAHSLWAGWAGSRKARRSFTGTATCSVPPTRWQSGSGSFNELEHIS